MGSYFSSGAKKGEKSGKNGGKSTVEKRRWRYRVVYTDREVKISELPHNMRGLVVMTRTGNMFMDEDGDLAHEFYQEKKVRNKKGVVRWIMQRISETHLKPQGVVKHRYPRLHVDCPILLLDSNAIIVPEEVPTSSDAS